MKKALYIKNAKPIVVMIADSIAEEKQDSNNGFDKYAKIKFYINITYIQICVQVCM